MSTAVESSPLFDIEKITIETELKRVFLYKAEHLQVDIFMVTHESQMVLSGLLSSDVFLRVESGTLTIDCEARRIWIKTGSAAVIPKGTNCTLSTPVGMVAKFYAVQAPPPDMSPKLNALTGTGSDIGIFDLSDDAPSWSDYRRVLYTGLHMQLVAMSLGPGVDIDLEMHVPDQFFRVEQGSITVELHSIENRVVNSSTPSKVHSGVGKGHVVIIPGTMYHRVVAGKNGAKLYTIYAPPQHPPTRVDIKKPEND